MAYFEPYIDAEGIHIPTYYDILEYITNKYKETFGSEVYLGEETPDYQMISLFSSCVADFGVLAVEAFNARNPNYCSGNSLDIIVQIAGLVRRVATASTAVLKVTGIAGTTIPAGSKAIDKNGYLWTFLSAVSIPEEGSATVNSSCDTKGAIVAPVGSIDGIYTPVVGWTEVTNEAEANVGRNVESDSELRSRFYASHTASQSGLSEALVSALLAVPEVKYVALYSNDTGSTDSNGIPAHSMCALVDGGETEKIAETIYNYKSPGTGTYGSVTETVVDGSGNEHSIKFSRPTELEVTVTVTITPLDGYESESVDPIIKQALIEDINSLGIGKNWNVTMGYKDIYSKFSTDLPISITSISATTTHGTSTSVIESAYNEQLVIDAEHVVIAT